SRSRSRIRSARAIPVHRDRETAPAVPDPASSTRSRSRSRIRSLDLNRSTPYLAAFQILHVAENMLMKRLVWMAAVATTATLSACGGSEVVVQAYTEQDGQPVPIAGMEVRALPYDRDLIFDSLRAAYPNPEPEIPADLTQLRDSIAVASQRVSEMNAAWAEGRDSLRILLESMQSIPRSNPRYLPMFNRYNAMAREVDAAQQASAQAFTRF